MNIDFIILPIIKIYASLPIKKDAINEEVGFEGVEEGKIFRFRKTRKMIGEKKSISNSEVNNGYY